MNIPKLQRKPDDGASSQNKLAQDAHVVVLLNCIVPQQKHVFETLAKQVGKLTILVSTQMEPNRKFGTDWGELNVVNQSNWMLTRKWKHRGAFAEDNYIHIPWKTKSELKRLKPDVVVTYEMGIRTLLTSLYCGKRVPWVLVANMSEHTEECRGRIRPKLRKFISKKATVATYNGPSCQRYMKSMGFRDDQLFFFPYSADPQKIYSGKRRMGSGPIKLAYGGALTERKNIVPFCNALVEWCREHPETNVVFSIAGTGPLKSEIECMALPESLRFEFLGHASADQLQTMYETNDLYVYPSLADEWGLGVEEALASGVPTIASKYVQSAETLIRDNQNGWLFDPYDIESMKDSLGRALATPRESLHDMTSSCRRATEGYSPRESAIRLCDAINYSMELNQEKKS